MHFNYYSRYITTQRNGPSIAPEVKLLLKGAPEKGVKTAPVLVVFILDSSVFRWNALAELLLPFTQLIHDFILILIG